MPDFTALPASACGGIWCALQACPVMIGCLPCNAELYVIRRVHDLMIVEHIGIGPASTWPDGYLA